MSKNISKKRLAELFRLAMVTYKDLSTEELSKKLVKICEKNEVRPTRYIPSGCLHSMREMCNCHGEYDTEWGYDEKN